jgi:hypothetical protein
MGLVEMERYLLVYYKEYIKLFVYLNQLILSMSNYGR